MAATWIGCASAQACELALVLAVDVSGSVDPGEYRLQMEGLGAALGDGGLGRCAGQGFVAAMDRRHPPESIRSLDPRN
ncbi:DUF1194 domain-containing protein [Litoreibacter halocynthiae]|uniref:DUF1194 domain-containing protein n=1 Tax=Litoreibacter halocynthiae TaxID=1242689 RepID=UPI00319DCAE2